MEKLKISIKQRWSAFIRIACILPADFMRGIFWIKLKLLYDSVFQF